jgi:hypothetical protein
MRTALVIILALVVTAPCRALDPGNHPILSKPGGGVVPPPPDPAVIRQGGDTIVDAVELWLPQWGVQGSTVGYTDDYDEACPYEGSTSPDVVYTFTAAHNGDLWVDMWGSLYDTKIYLYDADLNLIACNDDYYGDYTSLLVGVPVYTSSTYYLVIDGYGGDAGYYTMNVEIFVGEQVDCPMGAQLEGEPPLAVDYEDTWNGGCNSDQDDPPFQPITAPIFCGRTGYYLYQDLHYRDTDWFTVALPASGMVTIAAVPEFDSYLFELGPQDCGAVGVLQSVPIMGFNEGSLTVTGDPGQDVWIWFGPQGYESPNGDDVFEYDYVMFLDIPIAMKTRRWTDVKALFD